MLTKMTKEQFIESIQDAKEEKYVNMADVAKIGEEVKEAASNGTGKDILKLAEPVKKRGRKPGTKNSIKIPASWQKSIKASIDMMLAESAGKTGEAEKLIEEAEELLTKAETLGGMVK